MESTGTTPNRSNLFEEVVAVIHAHMAEAATVEESAMLRNRATGRLREVDVVIRANTGGHAVVVSVDASSWRRRPGRTAAQLGAYITGVDVVQDEQGQTLLKNITVNNVAVDKLPHT